MRIWLNWRIWIGGDQRLVVETGSVGGSALVGLSGLVG